MKRVFGLGLVFALSSCRLIAGIDDIQLTGGADGGGGDGGKDGGVLPIGEPLTSAAAGDAVSTAVRVLVDSNTVYVVTDNSIWSCATTGCIAPQILVPAIAGTIKDATLVGGFIYYTTSENGGEVHELTLSTKSAKLFRAVPNVDGIDNDGAHVFFTTTSNNLVGQLFRCNVGAVCTPTLVIDQIQQATQVGLAIVWNGAVYTAALGGSDDTLVSCGLTATCGTAPKVSPITGQGFAHGELVPTSTNLDYVGESDVGYYDTSFKKVVVAGSTDLAPPLAADATHLVVTNATYDVLQSVTIGGSPKLVPITGQAPVAITAVGVGGGYVYFPVKATGITLYRVKLP